MANEVVSLSDLKTMLVIKSDQNDDVLKLIIKNTVQALKFKLGLQASDTFPVELSYIPLEVCVRRFNRLKNEGMQTYTQEGQSITFDSNDFDDFLDDINAWKAKNRKNAKSLGHVQFINGYGG